MLKDAGKCICPCKWLNLPLITILSRIAWLAAQEARREGTCTRRNLMPRSSSSMLSQATTFIYTERRSCRLGTQQYARPSCEAREVH